MVRSLIKKTLKKKKSFLNGIDGIIFCTQTPDYFLPSNSSVLHGDFNFRENIFTLDISHACSGFLYALGISDSLIKNNICKKILIINADTYSKIINNLDRSTKSIFSDAAAITIVDKTSNNLMDIEFGASGRNHDKLILKGNAFRSNKNKSNFIEMKGMGIVSFVNSRLPDQINLILKKNNLKLSDINLFLFHQASKIALNSLSRILKIPDKKIFYDLENGNTVSASIPILISKVRKRGLIKKNDLAIISGFGVGLSWSTAIYRF